MAYLVNATDTAETTGGTTYTVTLGAHQTNDLLLCLLTNGSGVTAITAPGGWTMIGTQGASSSLRQAWAYKIAASGAETNPTFTGSSAHWIGAAYVIRDADTSTPIDGSTRADWAAATSVNTGALTTASNGCMLFYSVGASGSATLLRHKTDDATNAASTTGTNVNHIAGYRQQGSAGAAPVITGYASQSAGGNAWVVSVKNKTSGTIGQDIRSGFNELNWYGNLGAVAMPVTWLAPNGLATTVASLSVSSTLSTVDNNSANAVTNGAWGTVTGLSSTESTAGSWVGAYHAISSTDMSNKILAVEFTMAPATTTRFGASGIAIVLGDAGGNWAAYQLSQRTGIVSSVPYTAHVALGHATLLDSSGSIDWTAVTKVGYLVHRIGSSVTSNTLQVWNLTLLGTTKMTGGSASLNNNFGYMHPPLAKLNYQAMSSLQASAQSMAKNGVQIGDGAIPTYFDASASSFEFPAAYNATYGTLNAQNLWNVNPSQTGITIKASASDTINLTACVLATAVAQAFTIDAASSSSATYSFAGASLVGWTVTWNSSVACSGATFKGGGIADFKGATLTGVTLRDGTGSALCTVSSGFTANNCTFIAGSTSSYALRIAAAGTFNLSGTTFSGTVKDIDVTAAVGTVTINLATGQATPTYQTAGATVNIVSSPVFQTVTVSGAVAGSRIQVYDLTSSTELYNGTPTFPYTWTDGSAAVASRSIRLRVAKMSGTAAKNFIDQTIGTCGTTAGAEAVSYLVNQSDDTVYNTNAIDGSTVTGITITTGPSRVKINLAGGSVTWPSIYAYQVYWEATATGIAQETAFMTATDTANYILTSFEIRNTSATPLQITGGWGRDSVTGTVAGCIDAAGSTGNIYAEPDHVVAFSTGSGLTAGQAAQLAAAESATANLTYNGTLLEVDVKKMNGATVNGTGQSGDLWRG